MKTFLQSIKERAEQAKATLATADTLSALELEVRDTKAEYDKFRGHNTHIPHKQLDEAHAAWSTATQAVYEHRRVISEAEAILKECTPLLSAHADLATAHSAYAQARNAKLESIAEVSNLQKLSTELQCEVVDLSAKFKQATTLHGEASIAARLTGQQAPPTPKLLTTLSVDLESRKATLESAQEMLAKAESKRERATDSARQSRNEWHYGRARVATIEYHDALATIAPQVSMFLAALSGIDSYQTKIEFAPDREAIAAARELLDAELEASN